jgi:PhzF family phenazine biosynthesis protein
VDAFTSVPFAGNPAAVIVFKGTYPWPDDDLLQNIAAEFNLSETAFIRKNKSESPNEFDLRWFTPTKEVRYHI